MKKIASQLLTQGLLLALLGLLTGFTSMIDPTRPPNVAQLIQTTKTGETMVLSAVFLYSDRKIAIINNIPRQVGDHIGEYIVTSISLYTVELAGPDHSKEVLHIATPIKQQVL
jgi:hypothetical protein